MTSSSCAATSRRSRRRSTSIFETLGRVMKERRAEAYAQVVARDVEGASALSRDLVASAGSHRVAAVGALEPTDGCRCLSDLKAWQARFESVTAIGSLSSSRLNRLTIRASGRLTARRRAILRVATGIVCSKRLILAEATMMSDNVQSNRDSGDTAAASGELELVTRRRDGARAENPSEETSRASSAARAASATCARARSASSA